MEENHSLFIDIARHALAEYDMPAYDLSFLRHSDNVTFRVDTPKGKSFLLRIHIPITVAMGTHGFDRGAINSELLWLEALSRDTDLILQKPIRNKAGELVSQVPLGDGGEPVHCSLLTWLTGEPYQRDLETAETAFQIGMLLAKLHLHASQWRVPEGFRRPKRDKAYFEEKLNGLKPALQDGRISPSDYAEFEKSVGLLIEMMRSINENQQTNGIMHADAHKGNMLYRAGEIRLIDFSFCAFGNFMFDLGICLSDMKEQLHRVFIESYMSLRDLPENYPVLIEGFFVGSMVGTFCHWVSNPRAEKVLATKVPQIARDFAAKFNRGELFWFFGDG